MSTALVIREFETLKNSGELSKPEQQERLVNRVRAVMAAQPAQPQLPGATLEPAIPVDLAAVVARTTARFQDLTIDIPRITVTPIDGRSGYGDFNLDLRTVSYQPSPDAIYIQNLHDGKSSILANRDFGEAEREPEHYLVRSLMNFADIPYDSTAELLYKLAAQTIAHLRSYLPDEDAVHNVVRGFGKGLVDLIHAQMQEHFKETAAGYHVNLSKGFHAASRRSLSRRRIGTNAGLSRSRRE